ncbi:MAG: HupE/UreJ family protein [Bacteroidetes bacterium]|nr:HupE/UreJ family protein [Bacteroidota bacterium]MDA1119102.1 HupE/UreJ family protein [Bacteroidota bacterium]
MSEFGLYFNLGTEHILDIRGYDHILFVISLCVLYSIADWRKVLILVTAFTIGHSITLALATLGIITMDLKLIEFLIPVTIFITAVSNLFSSETVERSKVQINYVYASFFGLIHGMGFSSYLKSLLGNDTSIFTKLFSFNLGIEVGQALIVGIFLGVTAIFQSIFKVSNRDWITIISSAIAGIALTMMIENKFW